VHGAEDRAHANGRRHARLPPTPAVSQIPLVCDAAKRDMS
jgi:hypothetical protein